MGVPPRCSTPESKAPAHILDERVKGDLMKYLRLLRIFFVLSAITAGTSYLHATTLSASTTTIDLTCTMGQTCTSNGSGITFSATSSLSVDTGSAPFSISPL